MKGLGLVTLMLAVGVQATSHPIQPGQISLAVGADGSSAMNVTWITASRSGQAIVRFGTDSSQLDLHSKGSVTWYDFASVSKMAQPSGGIYHATMTGLAPATKYYYQVGDSNTGTLSSVLSFTTLPTSGPVGPKPFSFAVVGDLGQTADSATTVARMYQDDDIRAVVHVGDMAYADTDQTRWDSYGDAVQKLSSRVPWMVGAGNHEIESDTRTGFNFVPYEHRFNMPAVAPAVLKASKGQRGCVHPATAGQVDCTPSEFMSTYDYGNSFFSFDMADTHVITLNPYTSTTYDSPQRLWLQADLASLNRSRTPWLIVSMHCPWYNSNAHHHDESQAVAMKKNLEALLLSHHVDLVVAGHVHAYERVYPVANGKVTPAGITYLNVGGSGNHEGHSAPFKTPSPPWSAERNDKTFGHGKLTTHNSTHMLWVWYSNNDGHKTPWDQTWIIRDPVTFETRHQPHADAL